MTVALSRQNLRKWIDQSIRKFRNNDLLGVPETWLKIYESLADYIIDERQVDAKLLWMMEATDDSPADIIYQLQRLKNALTEIAAKKKTLEELLPVLNWFDQTIVVLVEKASGQMSTKRSLLAPYEKIFWNARDGMYISTIDGKFIHCNEALLDMFHFEKLEDLLELDIQSELYLDREARQVMLDHLLDDGFFDKHEFEFQCADGQKKTALESCFLVDTPNGKPYIAGVLVDVTQERKSQKRNQEYLQKIEKQGLEAQLRLTHQIKQFEALLQVNDHAVVIVELNHFNLVEANPAFFRKFRYGKKQLDQLSFRDLFAEEDWNRIYAQISQSLDRRHYHLRDVRYQNSQGDGFQALLSVLVQRDETGPRLLVQIEDRTEYQRILKLKQRYRQNQKIALNEIPIGLIGFHHDGSVALVNRHLLDQLGYSRRKMLHVPFINELFTLEEHRLKFHKYLRQFIAGQHAKDVPVAVNNSKGETLDFELSTTSFEFDEEEKPGCLIMLRDVTASKKLHQLRRIQETKPEQRDQILEKLQTQLKHLEGLNKDLSDHLGWKKIFIQQFTQKFQDPIEVVLGYASFLKQSLANRMTKGQKEDLQIIHDHIQFLFTTLQTAREYLKLEAGEAVPNRDPFIVRQLLDELFKRLQPDALPENLVFDTQHQILSMDWQIFTDIDMLEALLIKILRNAKAHTPEGSITLRAYEEDGRLCMEVIDTGTGIEPAELPRIFDPFYPANRLDPQTGMPCLGLGLAIVDAYVKLLGAEAEIQSKKGIGTKFTLWLETV